MYNVSTAAVHTHRTNASRSNTYTRLYVCACECVCACVCVGAYRGRTEVIVRFAKADSKKNNTLNN